MSTRPIDPLLPSCLDGSLDNAFNPIDAASYDPASWSYLKTVLPSVAPGIALGSLCLIGFIFFVIWIIVQFCVCCCHSKEQREDAELDAQFIKRDGSHATVKLGLDQSSTEPRRYGCTKFLQIFIVLLMLATVGVSGWGIYASLQYTDSQITNFWALVEAVDTKVNTTTAELSDLSGQLNELQASLSVINDAAGQVKAAFAAVPQLSGQVDSALGAAQQASSILASAESDLNSVIASVQEYMGGTITSMQNRFQDPSLTFEDTGRFIAIAVLFGLTIVFSIGAALLSLRVRHPKWASTFVALLWLFTALLMLLGVGLMQGVYVVGKDTCLYAETYAVDYAATKVTDPQKQQWIVRALDYYLVQDAPVNTTQGASLQAVTGFDAVPLFAFANGPLQSILALVQNPAVVTALGASSSNLATAVTNITTVVPRTTTTLGNLDTEVSRTSVQPLYDQIKSFLCCDISGASQDLFVAWTVVGCLAFVLALLCSWRIVMYTFKRQKAARRGL